MSCNLNHDFVINTERLVNLEKHQMHDHGRHQCCQCAYNQGYQQGLILSTNMHLDMEVLPISQAEKDGRHRSIHQAFALGYSDGVADFINQ